MILFFNILALGFLTLSAASVVLVIWLAAKGAINSWTPHWWFIPANLVALAWLFAQWVQS